MPKLFVDVDDTLVLYEGREPGPNPLGLEIGHDFRVNEKLIAAIKIWVRRNPGGQVVVWSGGGEDYARAAAERFIPGVAMWHFTKGGQNLRLPGQEDVVVDDSPFDLGLDEVDAPVLLPDQFIEVMGA